MNIDNLDRAVEIRNELRELRRQIQTSREAKKTAQDTIDEMNARIAQFQDAIAVLETEIATL